MTQWVSGSIFVYPQVEQGRWFVQYLLLFVFYIVCKDLGMYHEYYCFQTKLYKAEPTRILKHKESNERFFSTMDDLLSFCFFLQVNSKLLFPTHDSVSEIPNEQGQDPRLCINEVIYSFSFIINNISRGKGVFNLGCRLRTSCWSWCTWVQDEKMDNFWQDTVGQRLFQCFF